MLRVAADQKVPPTATGEGDGGSSPQPLERSPITAERTLIRREATRWLDPREIVRTAFHALFSTTITGYIDRRETLALMPRPMVQSAEGSLVEPAADPMLIDARAVNSQDGIWIDFIADIGDGFDATYAMAGILATKDLKVRGLKRTVVLPDGEKQIVDTLPRADVVVLGGDLVYPTPSREQYRNRLRCVLEAAFPAGTADADSVPSIFAIPGNHDWYDGLTNFIREFCQGQRLADWQMYQTRSYFAVKLPGKWWLWGIDIQFDSRIDPPQLSRFRRLAGCDRSQGNSEAIGPTLQEGDRVILCTAKPSWYHCGHKSDAFDNLDYFEAETIRAAKAKTEVTLAGDIHHYARYAASSGRQKITAGGGGSYLRGTHHLPVSLSVQERPSPPPPRPTAAAPPKNGGNRQRKVGTDGKKPCEFVQSGFPYPSRAESERLVWRTLALPLLPVNRAFCVFVGFLYVVFFWLLDPGQPERPLSVYLSEAATNLQWSRPWTLIAIGMVASLGLFCAVANQYASRMLTWLWGLLHGAAHAALALTFGWFVWRLLDRTLDDGLLTAAFNTSIILFGGFLGAFLFGLYLVMSDRWFSWHENEVFLAQNIPDYRSFIRMNITRDGSLIIYPIGVRRVPRRWRRKLEREQEEEDANNKSPGILEPADGREPQAHLIEGPIELPG